MSRAIIIFHENCMDGLASAYIADKSIKEKYDEVLHIPLNYSDNSGKYMPYLNSDTDVYMVDFTLKKPAMETVCKNARKVVVIDHHKTAEKELVGLNKKFPNTTLIFDMEESGTTLTYKYFNSNKEIPYLYQYIKDRDLWRWELPYSKEVSAYLWAYTTPNSLESFDEMVKIDIKSIQEKGEAILKHQKLQVENTAKNARIIMINDINFVVINSTENISEVGSYLVTKHKKPALIYRIVEDVVLCSLRSSDELIDVSMIAKLFGGGGHRNASGFQCSLTDFLKMIQC